MDVSELHPLSGTAILIVEDDDRAAADMSNLVRGAGGTVFRLARDGAAALQILSGSLPDGVLLNVGLVAGSGLHVARRLRELDLPFVVVSVFNRQDMASAELSNAPYFTTPYRREDVVRALVGVLEARRATKAAASPLHPLRDRS